MNEVKSEPADKDHNPRNFNMTRVADKIQCGIERIGVVLMIAMFVSIIIQVVSRYVLNNPTQWSEELARVLVEWVAMLGAASLARDRDHITVDIFVNMLPKWTHATISATQSVAIIISAILMTYFGIKLTIIGMKSKLIALEVPMAFTYCSLPVGFALTILLLIIGRRRRNDC